MPTLRAVRDRLKRAAWTQAAVSSSRTLQGRDLPSAVAENSSPFFSEIGEEPFFVARNIVLSGAAKARADLLALDHDGSAVVVVCAGDDREFLLARGITAVSILAGWKAENFVERLAESSTGSLAGFLRAGESRINASQRLVFVAERFDRETLSAVQWLGQQGAIEVACWQGVRVRFAESETPWFRLEQVFPLETVSPAAESKPGWISLERWLPQRLPGRNLGWLGTAAMALLLIFTAWRYGVASYPKDLSPAANTLNETLPLAMPGRVLDASTGQPVAGAKVFYAGRLRATDTTGQFKIEPRGNERAVLVKAAGYRQAAFALTDANEGVLAPRLEPLEVRALYLSYDNLPNAERRGRVLDLIGQTRSNAIIVGVKDASGYLSLAVDHELARKTRAFDPLRAPDLAAMVREWKSQGLYTIALVCLFKDDLLADSVKSLALRGARSKAVIRDRYGVAWVDPSSEAVQEYNLQAAKAAAEAGFDEIQFDFVRYPAEPASREGLTSQENQRRLAVVSEFLTRAANLLAPHNVYLGGSVFGSVCWMRDVSMIGQDLGRFAAALDYVSPMLYPSSFGPGEDSPVPVPMRNPYEVVSNSLLAAIKRLDGNARQLRPWLQNFPHDLNSRIPLRADQIRAQVKAAQDARASGWMLWDAGNSYPNTVEALRGLPNDDAESAGRRVTD